MAEKNQKGSQETIRRKSDRFLFDLFKNIESTRNVKKGLRKLLFGLKELGYTYPRVYRYDLKKNKYILVKALNLPPERFIPEKTSFGVSNPILKKLEEIIREGREEIYINEDVTTDLIKGKRDPLAYIIKKAKGEKVGLIGFPYVGFSETYNGGEIRGAIVLNYHPHKKIIDEREINMLEKVGIVIGVNVIRQLENKLFHQKQEELEEKNKELGRMNKKLEELTQQLAKQVKLDGPTSLYNKKTFHEDLEGYIKKANEEDLTYHLMLIDLDKFKKVNDLFGHPAGDKVISEIGNLLRKITEGKLAWPYRRGGDEFGIVAGLSSKEEVRALAMKIKERIKKIRLPSERCLPLTFSMGVLAAEKDDFKTGEEWYREADKVAYQAKKSRDRVIYR